MLFEGLVEACDDATNLLVVTGAGVSLASGIPTFRGTDPGAVWARDVTELGTREFFDRDPVASWSWYLQRFGALGGARPNPAHYALAALERWQLARGREFLLVTQNVDGLHDQAGSRQLVHVHGRADRVRCSRGGCEHAAPRGTLLRTDEMQAAFLRDPTDENLPRCPACGAVLRQHVLWFDEFYNGHRDYEIDRVLRGAKTASLVVFAGTSFSVGITDLILERALARGRPLFVIDPAARAPHPRLRHIVGNAEDTLPELCRRLGAT